MKNTFNLHSLISLANKNAVKAKMQRKNPRLKENPNSLEVLLGIGTIGKYQYRGCPCTGATYSVDGGDTWNKCGGVLEWCFSQADAESVMKDMVKDKGRFTNLSISQW